MSNCLNIIIGLLISSIKYNNVKDGVAIKIKIIAYAILHATYELCDFVPLNLLKLGWINLGDLSVEYVNDKI